MRTAWQIFVRDLKRLAKNPVAIIITIGVAILPSLYAWFNILANWDPYENTSTVPIAVVINDRGEDIEDMGYTNAGDMIREQLEENTQLGWNFVDTEDEAVEGVKSGQYYAAFVVPDDFTSTIAGVLEGKTDKAHIKYYVNEKANAVAPKVTDTGATTIENQISNEFVSLVGDTVVGKLQGMVKNASASADDARDGLALDLSDGGEKLSALASDLGDVQSIVGDARGTVASARSTLSEVDAAAGKLGGGLSSTLDTLQSTRSRATSLAAQLNRALSTGGSTISGVSSRTNYDIGQVAGQIGWAQGQIDAALAQVSALDGTSTNVSATLGSVSNVTASIPWIGGSKDFSTEISSKLSASQDIALSLSDSQKAAIAKLQSISDSLKGATSDVTGLANDVNGSIQATTDALADLQSSLASTTMPQLNNALDGFANTGGRLVGTVSSLSPMLKQADSALAELDGVLAQCSDTLGSTAGSIQAAADKVGGISSDVAAVESAENLSAIKDVLGLDSQGVGDFLGSPAELQDVGIYPVENYGSGVTPFYTNLALWVGGFVLVAIYKLEVDREGIGDFKPWQGFFGRWLLLNLIGLVQALVCCIGDLALGIQCENPAAFVFAGVVESFVYVFFIYALSVAFKHIGKALGVLIVVLQIPGASGLYPIEMQPDFFRALNPWLPFTYGINAMREAIAGFYGDYYVHNLLVLLVYLIPALLIGVAARRHLLNINNLFDRKLGETDMMITERVGMETPHFRLSTIVKALLDSESYKETFLASAASFELRYPVYIRRGFAALVVVPLALLVLMFATEAKFAMLVLWIVSLVVICTALIVIEYLHTRVAEKTDLADMSREDLYAMLDGELKQELLAFAPIDKMRLDRAQRDEADNGAPDAGAATRPMHFNDNDKKGGDL